MWGLTPTHVVLGRALIGLTAILIYAGVYNIAADTPHSQPVYWLLQTVRQQSIAARAARVVVPPDHATTSQSSSSSCVTPQAGMPSPALHPQPWLWKNAPQTHEKMMHGMEMDDDSNKDESHH
jgi:hypothetical protein